MSKLFKDSEYPNSTVQGSPLYESYKLEREFSQGLIIIGQGRTVFSWRRTGSDWVFGRNFFTLKGGEALAQVAQRNCGCLIPGSFQDNIEWGLEQPGQAKGSLSMSVGLELDDLKGPNNFVILWLLNPGNFLCCFLWGKPLEQPTIELSCNLAFQNSQ